MARRVSCGVLETQISFDMLPLLSAGLTWRKAGAADRSGSCYPTPGMLGRIRSDGEKAWAKARDPWGGIQRNSFCGETGIQLRPGSVAVLPGVPRLSGRKESVTTSALISGGAVTLLCELIPKSCPAPVIHLAGYLKF